MGSNQYNEKADVLMPSRQSKMSEVYNLVNILSNEISELQESSMQLHNGLMGPTPSTSENATKARPEPSGHFNILIDRLEILISKVRYTNVVLQEVKVEIAAQV